MEKQQSNPRRPTTVTPTLGVFLYLARVHPPNELTQNQRFWFVRCRASDVSNHSCKCIRGETTVKSSLLHQLLFKIEETREEKALVHPPNELTQNQRFWFVRCRASDVSNHSCKSIRGETTVKSSLLHHYFNFILYWGIAKSVRHKTLTLAFHRFESCYPSHLYHPFWMIGRGIEVVITRRS